MKLKQLVYKRNQRMFKVNIKSEVYYSALFDSSTYDQL